MSQVGAPVRSRGPVVGARSLRERSRAGRRAWTFPELDVPSAEISAAHRRGSPPDLPEVSEVDVVRHFTRLSQFYYAVVTRLYPLGSGSMKSNPNVPQSVAALPGF